MQKRSNWRNRWNCGIRPTPTRPMACTTCCGLAPLKSPRIPEEQLASAARDMAHLEGSFDGDRTKVIYHRAVDRAQGERLGAVRSFRRNRGGTMDPRTWPWRRSWQAPRAALSVDNARLYRDAQRLNEELEQRVISRTIELQNTNRSLEAEIKEQGHGARATAAALGAFAVHAHRGRAHPHRA